MIRRWQQRERAPLHVARTPGKAHKTGVSLHAVQVGEKDAAGNRFSVRKGRLQRPLSTTMPLVKKKSVKPSCCGPARINQDASQPYPDPKTWLMPVVKKVRVVHPKAPQGASLHWWGGCPNRSISGKVQKRGERRRRRGETEPGAAGNQFKNFLSVDARQTIGIPRRLPAGLFHESSCKHKHPEGVLSWH